MKVSYFRIILVLGLNFIFTYLLFGPLDFGKHIESPIIHEWATYAIIGSVIPLVLTILFYKFVDKKSLKSLGFRFKGRDVFFSFAIFFLMIIVSFGYLYLVNKRGVSSVNFNLELLMEPSFYLQFIIIGITWFIAGFYEEVLFRGYLVSNLKSLSKVKLYVVISIFFMIFHVFKGLNLVYVVTLMIMSLAFLYAYLKSGSLIPISFAHMTYNFVTSHIIGKSEISLIVIQGEGRTIDLLVLIAIFIVLLMSLTNLFYVKKEQTIVQKTDTVSKA